MMAGAYELLLQGVFGLNYNIEEHASHMWIVVVQAA